jgi:hypothetical protein
MTESFIGGADYWANNIRKEFRSTNPDQIAFCDTFKVLLNELLVYVKEYHTTGVQWNSKGGDVKDFTQTGDMSNALYDALYDYYFDDMPYGTKKARDGDPHEWVSDRFAQDIGLPIVLVVGMRLGCINHALLTVEAIQARGLRLAGWVANTIGPMTLLQENIATLEHLIPAPLMGVIPELSKELAQVPYSISAMEKAASYLKI